MIIAPSLLAAHAGRYAQEINEVENAGAKYLHIDVMDGHFVPNLSFGPDIIACLRRESKLVFDVHLMLTNPTQFCEPFIEAGADMITVHAEINEDIKRIHKICEQKNVGFGLAISPQTPVLKVSDYVPLLDMLLIMGINPGFGGQKFRPETLERISQAAMLRQKTNARFLIGIDGGVNQNNAGAIIAAGADVLVAGTAVFGQKDKKAAIEAILGQTHPNKTEEVK